MHLRLNPRVTLFKVELRPKVFPIRPVQVNGNDSTFYNSVGTQYKAYPTNSSTLSDVSIVVTLHYAAC